jgi:uncharacterized protein YvpB
MRDRPLDIPPYKQTKRDYACGPVCIGMAIDYLRKRNNKSPLNVQECLKLFFETMNGNLRRKSGTSKKAIKSALLRMQCRVKELTGNEDTRLSQVKTAIAKHHPVIVSCRTCFQGDRKRYAHYLVITYIDETHLYFNDPYPRRLNKVGLKEFLGRGESLCWGSSRWGIEVS